MKTLTLSLLSLLLLVAAVACGLWVNLELPADAFILWELRVPRVIMGALSGSLLALVGAAYQTLFQNPLATPSTVGTTAGATLGALLSLVLGLDGLYALSGAALFAFLGAISASLAILALAYHRQRRLEEVLLGGIAITLAAGAISQALHSIASAQALFSAAQWSLGYLGQVGYEKVIFLLIPWSICCGLIFSQRKAIAAFALGQLWAQSTGVDTRRTRLLVLLAGSLGVGSVVALAGPIAFVGLLVPHLLRALGARRAEVLLPLSALFGAGYLIAADFAAKFIWSEQELPVGVLTSALGAPTLFLAIWRGDKS